MEPRPIGWRAPGVREGLKGEVLTYFDISLHQTGCLVAVFMISKVNWFKNKHYLESMNIMHFFLIRENKPNYA